MMKTELQTSILVRVIGACLFCLLVFVSPEMRAQDAPQSASIKPGLVSVTGQREDGHHQTRGSGFFVAERHILTHHHLISFDREAVVRLAEEGAEFSTRVVARDEFRNLALLEIESAQGSVVTFGAEEAEVGQLVTVPRWERATGLDIELHEGTVLTRNRVTRRDSAEQPVEYFLHDQVGNARDFGFPVYDRCGSVIGVQVADPGWEQGSSFWGGKPDRLPDPEEWMHALSSAEIRDFLEPHVDVRVAQERCPTPLEVRQAEAEAARLEAEQAAREAEAAARRAEEAEQSRQASEQERELAARDAEEAAQEAEAARQEAERLAEQAARREQEFEEQTERLEEEASELEQELEELRAAREQEAERVRLYLLLAGGAILLLLGGAVFALRSKKSSETQANARIREAEENERRARAEAQRAPRPAPFGVNIKGQTGTGEPFAIKLPPLALGKKEGVTIGRSPELCDYVIADEEVSRQHFRLSARNGKLWIEDLESVNGTRLNDLELEPADLYEIDSGSEIRMGHVSLRLDIDEQSATDSAPGEDRHGSEP